MFSCHFEFWHLGIISRSHTSCLEVVAFPVWASAAVIGVGNEKRHPKWVPVINTGKLGMHVLGPQHTKIIKPPKSNFSSSFYNYAWPKEKEKIWNIGWGVWCHMAAQTKLPKYFKNKQGTFLFPFSNHMWAQHVRSSHQVDSQTLSFLAASVFSWNKHQGTLERSYNEVAAGPEQIMQGL